ncbi:hypothetical protein HGRIS_006710 [Hohenbuehelia grisea]|uniref:Uncharacterized protein n=1 Tax=Hohenbuehelia grisea TaxID=104357 RepID=A0ABR3J9V5_9AGAR
MLGKQKRLQRNGDLALQPEQISFPEVTMSYPNDPRYGYNQYNSARDMPSAPPSYLPTPSNPGYAYGMPAHLGMGQPGTQSQPPQGHQYVASGYSPDMQPVDPQAEKRAYDSWRQREIKKAINKIQMAMRKTQLEALVEILYEVEYYRRLEIPRPIPLPEHDYPRYQRQSSR